MKLIFAFLWLTIVTILLTLPGSAFPKENWFDKIWADKWIHIFLFSVLVFLWAIAMGKKYPTPPKMRSFLLVLACLGLVYGAGMEFIQKYFVPNRSFDTGDILSDALGACMGSVFSWYRYKKNKPL
jgi:VanZ family protein